MLQIFYLLLAKNFLYVHVFEHMRIYKNQRKYMKCTKYILKKILYSVDVCQRQLQITSIFLLFMFSF